MYTYIQHTYTYIQHTNTYIHTCIEITYRQRKIFCKISDFVNDFIHNLFILQFPLINNKTLLIKYFNITKYCLV